MLTVVQYMHKGNNYFSEKLCDKVKILINQIKYNIYLIHVLIILVFELFTFT